MDSAAARFNGARLRIVRTLHGLTLAQLGEIVESSRQFIFQLETGSRSPTPNMAAALADALQVAPRFFFKADLDEFRFEETHFRKLKKTDTAAKHRALAHGTMFNMLVRYFDDNLSLPKDTVTKLPEKYQHDIERAADACRVRWGLGIDRPIDSMARVLENAGVVVADFAGVSEHLDAFSRGGRRGIVVRSLVKDSPSRSRFDLAHELGHLSLHVGMETDIDQREGEADRFAGAFLMPETGFRREFPRSGRIDWSYLAEMKVRWRVSLSAIIHRAYDLGLIDAIRYRSANVYIRKLGWHRGEPLEERIPREPPETVPLSFARLQQIRGQSKGDVARELGWRPSLFKMITGLEVEETSAAPSSQDKGQVFLFPLPALPRDAEDQ